MEKRKHGRGDGKGTFRTGWLPSPPMFQSPLLVFDTLTTTTTTATEKRRKGEMRPFEATCARRLSVILVTTAMLVSRRTGQTQWLSREVETQRPALVHQRQGSGQAINPVSCFVSLVGFLFLPNTPFLALKRNGKKGRQRLAGDPDLLPPWKEMRGWVGLTAVPANLIL